MFNPVKSGHVIPCYGRHGARAECRRCPIRGYCRDAKKELRIESSFCNAGEFTDRIPAPEPVESQAPESRTFAEEEMLQLVNFFLMLSPQNFMILKLRLLHPELSSNDLAKLMRLRSGAMIKEFLSDIAARYPALRQILNPKAQEAKS